MIGHEKSEESVCNLCGSNKYRVMYRSRGYQIVQCNQCGLLYTNPRLTPEALQLLYEDSAYSERNPASWTKEHSAFFHRELARIEFLLEGRNLLEVGCGGGYFLYCAKQRGWKVHGQDISSMAANHVRDEYGIDIFVGQLEETPFTEALFDAVFMCHVLEHVTDAKQTLKTIHRLLKPNGLLVIVGPNVASPDLIFNAHLREIWYHLPYHNYHFTHHSLQKFLQATGFETSLIEYGVASFLSSWLLAWRKVNPFVRKRLPPYALQTEAELEKTRYSSPTWKTRVVNVVGSLLPNSQLTIYGRKAHQ